MKRIRRCTAVLVGAIGMLAVFSAAAPAFAMIPGSGGGPDGAAGPPAVVRTVVVGGMPGWQITLIAIASALIAAAAAVIADRARRQRPAITPA